jgi:hypothetical protein
MNVPDRVRGAVGELGESTLDQGVWWAPGRWRDHEDLAPLRSALDTAADASETAQDSWKVIRRRHVFALASGDPLVFFAAAMAWGHGDRGLGPTRTARIVTSAGDDLAPRIEAISLAARNGAADGWDALHDPATRLKYLGPSFGTKLTYFAGYGAPVASPPLIADLNTAWAMWDLIKLRRSAERRSTYLDYVAAAVEWSRELCCQPHDVELALFHVGKEVRGRRGRGSVVAR